MSYADAVLKSIDWASQEVLRGTGEDLRAALTAFLACPDSSQVGAVWWDIENVVFAQNTIYGAAPATVEVMIAALADERPSFMRGWILEALRFLVMGESADDPSLQVRCRDRLREGAWLLAYLARSTFGEERQLVLDLLEQADPRIASIAREGVRE